MVDHEAYIGYGYMIFGDDQPEYPFDNPEAEEKYEEWENAFRDSSFRMCLSYYYDCDCDFFGIKFHQADEANFTEIDEIHNWVDDIDPKEWQKCQEEFKQLFPNYEGEPHLYLMSVVW